MVSGRVSVESGIKRETLREGSRFALSNQFLRSSFILCQNVLFVELCLLFLVISEEKSSLLAKRTSFTLMIFLVTSLCQALSVNAACCLPVIAFLPCDRGVHVELPQQVLLFHFERMSIRALCCKRHIEQSGQI